MIKWPEPANQSLAADIAALDCRYRGSPSYEHDAAYMRKAAENLVLKGYSIYTEAQLKQAVRDAYEDAAKTCDRLRREQIRYFNGMGSAGCPEYGPSDCADAIRALIEEIEA